MATDPIHQFQIEKLVDFGQVTLPLFGRTDLAFTNSHLAMTLAFAMIVLFMTAVTANMKVVPGRLQAVGEGLFGMIDNLSESIIGHEGRKLFPFVFTVFSLDPGDEHPGPAAHLHRHLPARHHRHLRAS